MAVVQCKYCGGSINHTGTGTVFCPACKKGFWAASPSAQSTPRTSAAKAPQAASSLTKLNIIIALLGLGLFSAGGFLILNREEAPVEDPAERAQLIEVEKELASVKTSLASENVKLEKAQADLAIERKLAETMRWRHDQQVEDNLRTFVATQEAKAAKVPPPSSKNEAVTSLLERCEKMVVLITTNGGMGSGFVVSEDGFVATNAHVVGDATNVGVHIQRKDSRDMVLVRGAKVIAVHADHDLALIKMPEAPATVSDDAKYPAVKVRDEKAVKGEEAFAMGNPGAGFVTLTYTVTRGIISNPLRTFGPFSVVQTTAVANPGNSGGPLFDAKGLVIGVVSAKLRNQEQVTFAVPADVLKEFLDRHRVTLKK